MVTYVFVTGYSESIDMSSRCAKTFGNIEHFEDILKALAGRDQMTWT